MEKMKQFKWAWWIVVGIVVLIILGLGTKEWQSSQVIGKSQYRFNLVVTVPDIGVTFVSFDPTEELVLALPFPQGLAISSRSKGEYSISSLYALGSYTGNGGKFVRQKIQGFMRVPVPGYVVISGKQNSPKSMVMRGMLGVIFGRSETSISRFDALLLLGRASRYGWREVKEEELLRAGVIENKQDELLYHPDRLQEYVGTRLFDWGIGARGVSVAIINGSGENGLGSDMADFLSNLGMDVVMVRSATSDEIIKKSSWQVGDEEQALELGYIFEDLFELDMPKIEEISKEFRSSVVVIVGTDALELF